MDCIKKTVTPRLKLCRLTCVSLCLLASDMPKTTLTE